MSETPNSEPPNEPPSREAVEAAIKRGNGKPLTTKDRDSLYEPPFHLDYVAVRILAAEVQRLRVECEELKHARNRAGMEARREMMDGFRKQIKPGPDKPVTEPDLYCGACGQPSAQSLWFSGSHTAMCPLCAAEFVCGAGK